MKNYCALVENGVVAEIIVAAYSWVEQTLAGDWHDLGGEPLTVAVGWIYENGEFTPPPPPEPIPNE